MTAIHQFRLCQRFDIAWRRVPSPWCFDRYWEYLRMSDLSFPGFLIGPAIILPQPWLEVHTWADQMAKLWSTYNMFNSLILSINVSFSYATQIYADNTLQHSSLSHSFCAILCGFLETSPGSTPWHLWPKQWRRATGAFVKQTKLFLVTSNHLECNEIIFEAMIQISHKTSSPKEFVLRCVLQTTPYLLNILSQGSWSKRSYSWRIASAVM